jgi:hypothetical protein
MAIQIGKYRRPGIFVEEFDQSIITSPETEGVNALVAGFSRKGPVNTPIRLTSIGDLEAIYGPIDRGLERKGSYFHRTISKLLESTTVYALNLLATDDELDRVDYVSLSAATNKSNGTKQNDSYRKIFDTTGFWKRSTDDFLSMVSDDSAYADTVLHITNVSDKPVSVFIFKSAMTGFDRTLIEWYGTAEKVPTYLSPNDWASDYMVDVVVVGGDWSNYSVLSVDPRWSAYFDANGLSKFQVRDFVNDRNVNLLAFYEGASLIPFFRDGNGRNIFIENIINNETDKTGLFCVFNVDLVETDYPMGMVDLVGNNLVTSETQDVNYLSYNVRLTEQVTYDRLSLDTVGNVHAILPAGEAQASLRDATAYDDEYVGTLFRGASNAEGYVSGVTFDSVSQTTGSVTVYYNIDPAAYAIIGGQKVDLSGATDTFVFSTASFALGAVNATFSVAIYADSTGQIKSTIGSVAEVNPTVSPSDIVLTQVSIGKGGSGLISGYESNDISVNLTGFREFSFEVDYDVTYTDTTATVTFLDTAAAADVTNYEQYRKIRAFNQMYNLLSSSNRTKMVMLGDADTQDKIEMSTVTASGFVTSSFQNKAFTLTFSGLDDTLVNLYPHITEGMLVLYTLDNEFYMGKGTVVSKAGIPTEAEGVAGKQSKFYLDYVNGNINSMDYFYTNLVDRENGDVFNVEFVNYQATPYIVIKSTTGATPSGWPASGVFVGQNLLIPGSTLNKSAVQIYSVTNSALTVQNPSGATYGAGNGSDGVYVFELNTEVTDEAILNIDAIYDYDQKHYFKLSIDTTDNLLATITDNLGQATPLSTSEYNVNYFSMDVFSNKVNYKQTVEVTYPTGYTSAPNKILVEAARYTEIKVGDYLKAYVDEANLQTGESPRRLTRVLSKRAYAADTTLVEISCDARIDVVNYGTEVSPEWQTTRYTKVEDYVRSYKAITLGGFKVRQASIPDGTETRQNEILNVMAKGTPLFNALANKEALNIRYLVDSFGLGLIEKSKQQLVDLCGDRLDCFGFINMPSLKQLRTSANPSFVNADRVLDTSFIAVGGDPESNPSFLYSFGTGRGSTCVGYFLPYVEINDNGRPLELPPAMFVATTYLRKHNLGTTTLVPWTIAAGVTNGRVTGFTKTEAEFTLLDIENLNQAQMNPIVFKRNRGYVIETENTAQTLYKSSLSYIHVREVLIELERELSRMLLDFQWKFNTPDIRAEIKLRADVICEQYINLNGLYNYFNKCDDENNTTELISRQIGVLDTYVEPVLGMGIIVNNITILRTGAIQSGGFVIP